MDLAVPAEAPWRAKLQAVIALAMFAGAVLLAAYVALNYFRETGDGAAYRSARSCSAAAALDARTCRFDGQARVLSVQADYLHATVAFDSLAGRSFEVTFFGGTEPPSGALTVGATATATLWDGRVTAVDGHDTTENPESTPPSTDLELGAFFGLLGVVGLFFSVRLARKAWAG